MVQNGSARLGLAPPITLFGAVTATVGSPVVTVQFASPGVTPPVNPAFLSTGNSQVGWLAFVSGAGNGGGTLISYLTPTGVSVAGNTLTLTVQNNATTAVNSTVGSPTEIVIFANEGIGNGGGSPANETYQRVTTTSVTMPLSDGVPQGVINAALAAKDVTHPAGVATLNVTKVAFSDANLFSGLVNAGADVNSQVQILGAGRNGTTYNGTIVAQSGNNGNWAYVYPPVPTTLTATPDDGHVWTVPVLAGGRRQGAGAVERRRAAQRDVPGPPTRC